MAIVTKCKLIGPMHFKQAFPKLSNFCLQHKTNFKVTLYNCKATLLFCTYSPTAVLNVNFKVRSKASLRDFGMASDISVREE